MTKLYGDINSLSFAGVHYTPGEGGAFEVPEEAVAELLCHGLSRTPPKSAAPDPVSSPLRDAAAAEILPPAQAPSPAQAQTPWQRTKRGHK
jgi:hypothetical protein